MVGMKQFLLMIAVVALVGCGTTTEETPTRPIVAPTPTFTSDPSNLQNVIIKERIREARWRDLNVYVGPRILAARYYKTGFERVRQLDLSNTQITDAGLKEVAKMKQLIVLILDDTKVTKAGVAQLQKALPKCKIIHNAKK